MESKNLTPQERLDAAISKMFYEKSIGIIEVINHSINILNALRNSQRMRLIKNGKVVTKNKFLKRTNKPYHLKTNF